MLTDLEMAGVSELAATVLAREATLVVVDEHVVVKAVLAGEGCVADKAHKRFDSWNRQNRVWEIK